MENSILIFKTNINTFEQLQNVNSTLSQRAEIKKWNVDLEDCDKVLRVEARVLEAGNIMEMLKPYAIHCEELQ